MSTKRMSRIIMLAALCIALRVVFGAFPNIKPISAIFLVSLLYLSLTDSMCIMMLTMLGSSLLFGFGIVVLWQISSFAFILLFWNWLILPLIKKNYLDLKWQSLLAGVVIFLYGFTISFPAALQYGANPIAYWLNGLSFDLLHAVSTTLFYPIIYTIFRRLYPYEKNRS